LRKLPAGLLFRFGFFATGCQREQYTKDKIQSYTSTQHRTVACTEKTRGGQTEKGVEALKALRALKR
jgi:hypothetical protein